MSYTQSRAIIVAEGLEKRVTVPEGELTLLKGVDLSIFPGEAVAVVGASGAGKSTLLGLLAGMDTPTGGRVFLDGVELSALDEDGRARLRAARVGFVFQAFHLLPNLTALENVMLPLELGGHGDAGEAAHEVLQRVGLAHRLHHYPKQLSGGEQQRVALARAFAPQPKLLFADEPTGNLDSATGQRIIDLLFAMNREHATTLVLVTHDENLAQRCGRRLELDAGRLKGLQ
ncbi:MAG: ABC transporter ATP-binding protein [Gammaproteobacteria bacterium]|jgi:putative ABC transport system ATP-binding protein